MRRERDEEKVKYTNIIKFQKTTIRKTFKNNFSWWTFQKENNMEKELEAYEIIKENSIIAPEIKNVDRKKKYYEMSICNGKDLLHNYSNFSIEQLKKIMNDVGGILAKIHKIKPTEKIPDFCNQKYYDTLKKEGGNLKLKKKEHNDFINMINNISKVTCDDDIVFVHGDFHFGNIIVDDSTITGIIDWEECCKQSRYIDIATMLSNILSFINKKYQDDISNSFLLGYSLEAGKVLSNSKIGLFMELNYYKHQLFFENMK
jgi:thiamine kinase-like enzyme